jgi:hypothetical protein
MLRPGGGFGFPGGRLSISVPSLFFCSSASRFTADESGF